MDTRIKVRQANIIDLNVDAIVNAAKPSLLGGGGVDGAIHRAAGPKLLEECRNILTNEYGNRCNYGDAKITKGYNLKAKYIIHTVGPVWKGGNNNEDEILRNSYKNILKLAEENNIKTIAIPAISTGAYGYPFENACKIALESINELLEKNNIIEEVILVAFKNEDYDRYVNIYKNLEKS